MMTGPELVIFIFMLSMRFYQNQAISKFGNYTIQICIQSFSMSLFAVENGRNEMERPSRLSKSERFRLQIRRKHQEQIFKTVRQQFVDALKCLNFLEELKTQKDNMNAQKIHWLIQGLRDGQNSASFYQDISDMQLESYLCDLVLNEQFSIQNRTKIMRSLVQLTYFSCKIPNQLIENNLIDYFRVQLNKMSMNNEQEQNFAYQIASLVLNLTGFKNQSFNYHMIEFDFLPVLLKSIQRNEQHRGEVGQMRQLLLKIYGNLFLCEIKDYKFVANLLNNILFDQQNSANQDLLCCTLSCLTKAAKIPNFWHELQKLTIQNGEIFAEIINLANIIHTNFTENSFYSLLDFLIALFQQCDGKVTDQANQLISQFPGDFFLEAFKKLKQNQKQTNAKKTICRLIKLVSKLDTLYKTIYHNNINQQNFISGIMQKYVIANPISRKYLSRVLTKVLTQDKCAIDILINNGIVDVVRDLLDSEYSKDQKVDVIDLVEALIDAEEELRDRTQGENKMINVFEDRGIIRDLERLQDDHSKDVYQRAEQFMGKLCKLKQNSAK